MWRPSDVVPEHKKRAIVLWLGLILAIIAYSIYLVYSIMEQRANPSTSYVLSNDLYTFPDVYVCLYNYLGCDSVELESDCKDSAFATEEDTSATFNPGGDDEQPIGVRPIMVDGYGHCVQFNTSEVDFSSDTRNPEDYVRLDVYWYPGGSPNNSTTCIAEEGQWQEHSESVTVFLRDSKTGDFSAGTQVPYTCITNSSDRRHFDFMGIGLTREVSLAGVARASYKPITVITTTHKFPTMTNVTAPYAHLSMEVAQKVDSLEIITEIDPLEVAEIFGNIGGCWDFLLFLWPLFFVAASNTGPSYKFREFKKLAPPVLPSRATPSVEEAPPAWVRDHSVTRSGRVSAPSEGKPGRSARSFMGRSNLSCQASCKDPSRCRHSDWATQGFPDV